MLSVAPICQPSTTCINIAASKALRFRAGKAAKDQLNATGQGRQLVAPGFFPPFQRELQDVFGRGQTRAHYAILSLLACSIHSLDQLLQRYNVLADALPRKSG
jgi:hypothetical protein